MNDDLPYDGYFDLRLHGPVAESMISTIATEGFSQPQYEHYSKIFPHVFDDLDVKRNTKMPSVNNQAVAIEALESMMGLLPMIRVTECNGIITISGIPTNLLTNYILKNWKTSRIANNILLKRGMRWFSFYSFYAIEIVYMLETLMGGKNVRTHMLREIVSVLKENTWLADIDRPVESIFDYSKLDQLTLTLLSNQMDYLKEYEEQTQRYDLTGYVLASPPGTGKTLCGYAMSLVSGAETTIFVVPNNSVDKVWVDTLKTRFKKPKTYWSSHGTAPITGKEDYIICHYEALKTVLANVRKFGNRKVMVWLDESHNFNELTAARTRMFVELCQTVNLIVSTWASGTPFKAIGKEAVPMLRCICAQFTPPVEESFVKIFGATKGAALDILGNRMGKVMFKVPKTDVVNNERYEFVQPVTFVGMQEYTLEAIGKQLVSFIQSREIFYRKNMPEYVASFNKIMEDVRPRIKDGAEMNKFSLYLAGTKKLHTNFQPIADRELVVECNIIEREIIYPKLSNLEKKELKRVASVYKYVSLTIRGEALGRILTRARIDCFKEMVPNANLKEIIETARKKTLIFTSYVEVADAIYKQLISDGFKPLIVYGDTNKNLSAIMNQFKSDPEANPIIATFDSLSTAVPVIEASTVIMFNAPFRDYIRDQAVSRADRLGQDGAVTIANVLLDTGEQENISTRSKDIMQWSKEQVDAIMQLDDANLTKLALEEYGFALPRRLKLF